MHAIFWTMKTEKDESTGIRQTFTLKLLNGKKIKAVLDESKLAEILYTVESVYTKLGPEFVLSLDMAMASGGSEAIAESFYAIIGTQGQWCHQSNRILELGWCDIEKNRYIDIEKKISIISTISNYANWNWKTYNLFNFIIYSLCTASKTEKTKLPETSQTLKYLFTTVYECLKIYLFIQA